MEKEEIRNAVVESTMLGYEDHGIFTAFIFLNFGGSGQGFGGYPMDTPIKDDDGKFIKRVGTKWGMDFLIGVLKTLEVDSWEKLPGISLRVAISENAGTFGQKISGVGHYFKDNWFYPKHISPNTDE